jgi:glutaredoxin-related protein
MMTRPVLAADKMSPEVHAILASFHRGIVDEVAATVARDPVVVVGMAQNPVVKNARKLLEQEGIKYTYLEYGSYFSKWKERLAIKLWAGFGTFPMVFIDGELVGGHSELVKLKADGKLKKKSPFAAKTRFVVFTGPFSRAGAGVCRARRALLLPRRKSASRLAFW